jgi:hypothetical protein
MLDHGTLCSEPLNCTCRPPYIPSPCLVCQGALKEVLENMDQTRTVWHMQLDHQRNRVLRLSLIIRCVLAAAPKLTQACQSQVGQSNQCPEMPRKCAPGAWGV